MIRRNILAGIVFIGIIFPVVARAQVADSLRVAVFNSRAGVGTLYTLSFVSRDTLPPDARFVLTFPAGFDLSQVMIAGSATMDGGFEVAVNGQQVLIKRKGEGKPVLPGAKVDLKFSLVKNTKTPGTYTLGFVLQDGNGDLIGEGGSTTFVILP